MLLGQAVEPVELGGLAQRVRDHESARSLAERLSRAVRVERQAMGVDIRVDGSRPCPRQSLDGGGRREPGKDQLVALGEPEDIGDDAEGVSSRAQCEYVVSADIGGNLLLQAVRIAAGFAARHHALKLLGGSGSDLEGDTDVLSAARGCQAVQILLDAAYELVDHLKVHLSDVVVIIRRADLARVNVTSALA